MWCLETIIELNNKAKERHDSNDHPLKAFNDVGCNIPCGTRLSSIVSGDVINNPVNNPINDCLGDYPPNE